MGGVKINGQFHLSIEEELNPSLSLIYLNESTEAPTILILNLNSVFLIYFDLMD